MPGKMLPVEQRTRAELLLFTMIYSKNPLDYEELIKMLKARGLIIADEQKAINSLRVISYFRLANYLRPMEYDKENH